MFIYSLSGLQLTDDSGPEVLEVEDNETTARTGVYQTLGRLFLPPDEESWELTRDGRWSKELTTAGTLLAYDFDPGDAPVPSGDLPEHRAEYARLFTDAILAGSWFDDAERTHQEVVRFYEYFGLSATDDARPVDHLVTECDFMQYLTYKEAASGSKRLRESYRRAQLDFLDRHLSIWVPRLAAHVDEAGGETFYRWCASTLAGFVRADHAYVRELAAT